MGCCGSKSAGISDETTPAVSTRKLRPDSSVSSMSTSKKDLTEVPDLVVDEPEGNETTKKLLLKSEVLQEAPEVSPGPTPRSDSTSSLRSSSGSSSLQSSSGKFPLKIFKFRELAKATQNFKEPDMVLGEGGFGKVYKGWLKDASISSEAFPVAIKRLNPNSFQGQQEWLTEILLLGKLQHPGLVRLHGYCADNEEGLLVYEFLSRGSLDYHLFLEENSNETPLPWVTRLKIAFEAAQGLSFLHDNSVIHRDFKPPNIILDESWNAKLTDFGLAKGADVDQTHVTTRIMGTMGYLDPKYMETGQLTKKSDVYSFGVFLLELLTGRRAADPLNPSTPPLTTWAQQFLSVRKPDILKMVDPTILHEFELKPAQRAAHKVAISAKHCIEDDPTLRPLMSDMVETLRPLAFPKPSEKERAAAE